MAIFLLVFVLEAMGIADYEAAHDEAQIASQHQGPKASKSDTINLDVGAEVMVAPTLGAKKADGEEYQINLCVIEKVSCQILKEPTPSGKLTYHAAVDDKR